MKVELNRDYDANDPRSPRAGSTGEALYYRYVGDYKEELVLVLAVLFYGYGGIWFCPLDAVKSVL